VGDPKVTLSTGVDLAYRRPGYTIVPVAAPYAPPAADFPLCVDTRARVNACIEMIAAAGCCPDVLVLFGIVHGCEVETDSQMGRAIDARRRLGGKLLFRPGNPADLAPPIPQPRARKPPQKP
jgi:hypothetical protein